MLCPICKKAVADLNETLDPNPYFPFCSERCKLVDLGRWLGERYYIPLKPSHEDPSDSPVHRRRDEDD